VPTACDAQGANKFFEVDGTRFIRVEDVEDIFCKAGRIAEREELAVDFLEFRDGQGTRGAVFDEAWVRVLVMVLVSGVL